MQSMIIKTHGIVVITAMMLYANLVHAQTLKGRLIFDRRNIEHPSLAKGMKIIVVPRTNENEKIIANNFFYGEDKFQLEKMKAVTTYTNSEGNYYFSKIPAGRYILKVCWAYGMSYKFRVIGNQNSLIVIKDMPATTNSQIFN